MKKDILKIAGVKSEKELYAKYGTEAEFMAKHGGAFKKAVKKAKMGKSMVNKQLTQLTDFSNPPQAQDGAYMEQQPQIGDYIGGQQNQFQPVNFQDYYDQLDYSNTGMTDELRWQQQQAQQQNGGGGMLDNIGAFTDALGEMKRGGQIKKAQNAIPGGIPAYKPMGLPKAPAAPSYLGAGAGGGNVQQPAQASNPLGQISKYLGPAGQVVNAVTGVIDAVNQQKQAKQSKTLADLSVKSTASAPAIEPRKYLTPEMMAYGTKQPGQTIGTGVGNPFLAAYGATIGGNPTEIQNMYNPGDLYSDLGYEPLNDSQKVKQYGRGGAIPKAFIGQAIGAGAQVAGDIVSGVIGMGTNNINKQTNNLLGQAAFQSGMQGSNNQYNAFMEDGGWVSHDWQPQVITQFGGYDMKDLLRPDETMDTLRSGGHLKSYTAPSEEAMSTERQSMALGGQLQTHWGGKANVVSYNPKLEDGTGSGESISFDGLYHSQSAGKGKKGIGITFGESPVEVENGEPGQKMSNGGSAGDESFIVFGAKDWSNVFNPELNFPNISGKKIKSRVNSLNDMEAKQNKIVEKSNDELAKIDPSDAFDLLKFNSYKMKTKGADKKYELIAQDKKTYAAYQEGVLKLFKDNKFHPDLQLDDILKGKIKYGKDPNMAKSGIKLNKAQSGVIANTGESDDDYEAFINRWPNLLQSVTNRTQPVGAISDKQLGAEDFNDFLKTPDVSMSRADVPTLQDLQGVNETVPKKGGGFDWMDLYNAGYQAFRPGIKNRLGTEATAAEILALSQNTLPGVQAQSYQPILEDSPAMVVFQDQLNEIQADANASKRLVGNNPSALAMIDAQAYAAKNKVLAEQFRINQGMKMESMRQNIAKLNDATLKNLAIRDQQYVRQQESISKTKAIAQSALASIADKIGKNKAETLAANVTANMYPQYRFGPNGRIMNTGLTKFNTGKVGDMTMDELKKSLADDKTIAKNGSIVKAIKNL